MPSQHQRQEEEELFANMLEAAAESIRRGNNVVLPTTTTIENYKESKPILEFDVEIYADGELLESWQEWVNYTYEREQ